MGVWSVWTVENISLHTINEEEFQGSLSGFVEAIEFLTTVSKSSHHTLFSGDDILQQIFQSIIIPNVMFQNEDEVLFEMYPIEFIRRDMERSNIDTKRRIACELLKGIAMHYKDKVAEKVTAFLDLYAFNPIDNWRYKDCAIYLVLSLATKNAGGTSVSTDVVDLQSFFEAVIVPELQDQDVPSFPMLKAGALKFFTSFRNQISKPVALTHLPDVIMLLNSTNYVVRSYAAICIEKHLLVKDDGSRARYTEADIYPFLLMLLNHLFGVIYNPKSEENQYVMKCIMRVVCVAVLTPDVASLCIGGLITVLDKVCQNPKNPVFNHYLFESLAAFIRRARWAYEDTSLIALFERNLFPRLRMILVTFIPEFFPYSLQLLAQLVDVMTPSLPVAYVQIFDIFSLPNAWSMSENTPALVCLLKAIMQKAPQELNKQGRLSCVLGMSNMLVSFSTSEDRGFYVLNSVIENLGFEVISPHVSHIWVTLFYRLQNNKTMKSIKNLIIFMSLFLVKYGSQNLVSSVNAVQPGVFQAISKQFWIPNLKLMTGPEFKLTSVASTRLICDSPDILDIRLWGKMLDSIMTLFSRPGLAEQERVDDEPEIPEFGETIGYNTTSTRLYNAGKKEEDPLKEITDPRQFLVMSLSNLFAAAEGKYPQVISENLEMDNQAALLQLCNLYKVSIV